MAYFEGKACQTGQVDLFFPLPEAGNSGPAKAICRECPVRFECLNYALAQNLVGVWGGTTTEERKRLRRKRGLQGT